MWDTWEQDDDLPAQRIQVLIAISERPDSLDISDRVSGEAV